MVLVIDEDDFGCVGLSFLIVEFGVAADDDEVAYVYEPCGGAVKADCSGAWCTGDGISGEAIAIIDIVDVDLFPFADIGGLHEDGVDGDGAFVVEAGIGNGSAVNF